jgi:hypothetical protein
MIALILLVEGLSSAYSVCELLQGNCTGNGHQSNACKGKVEKKIESTRKLQCNYPRVPGRGGGPASFPKNI